MHKFVYFLVRLILFLNSFCFLNVACVCQAQHGPCSTDNYSPSGENRTGLLDSFVDNFSNLTIIPAIDQYAMAFVPYDANGFLTFFVLCNGVGCGLRLGSMSYVKCPV